MRHPEAVFHIPYKRTIIIIELYKYIIVVVEPVEMWMVEMCTAVGHDVYKKDRSSPGLSTSGTRLEVAEGVSAPVPVEVVHVSTAFHIV